MISNWCINKEKQVRIILLLTCFFIQINSYGQVIIKGDVYNQNNSALQQVSVIIEDSTNDSVLYYTYTNEAGSFQFDVYKTGIFNLKFRCLGYEHKTIITEIRNNQKEIKLNVNLKEKPISIDEVIIQAERPISIKKDTISFITKYFTNGTEQTIEELLEKIPGLQIDCEGAIKVGNKEIEKIMVEGDDLFEKGYKILSKNMPAYPIKEVVVLKNYSNNKLLKGIENSDKVALNLKLKEKTKRIWFGNTEANIGNDSYYKFKGNLMNFGKKNKYYFLTNLNNIGYDATGDIEHLIRNNSVNQPSNIGDNQQVNNPIDLSIDNLDFRKSITNCNNAKLTSLNAIFNPTNKLKIKTLGFFNWDKTNLFRKNTDIINIDSTTFTNIEDYKASNKQIIAFGKIDATYNVSKKQMIESSTKYNNGNFHDDSNLIFNSNSTVEDLQYHNTLFDHKINYTNKFNDKKVLLLTGRYIYEKTSQNYIINQLFYQSLFPTFSNADNIKQQCTNQMKFGGINAHLLNRKQNDNLLELQLGNEYRVDKLSSIFSLFENESLLGMPNNYQNQTTYHVNNLYLKSKYRYKFNNLAITTNLHLNQLFNRIENCAESKSQYPFFINPSIGFDWRINNKNILKTSYSYNTTNSKVLDIYSNYILTGFRTFSKGTNNFNQLDASSIVINYQSGNWTDRIFINTFLLYIKNHDFFSTNTVVKQNFTQSEKILIKNREFLSVNFKLDYYLKFISSNLKLDLSYSRSEFKNIVNNSNLRKVKGNNYKYGLELRSGFKGIFNYHIGTKWTTNQTETTISNSLTNNVSFFDLCFVFNDNLNFQLKSERYSWENLDTDNTYYFLDFDARYQLMKNKLTLGLTGKNLFNTEKFKNLSISDIGSSTKEYRLLPRIVLLKIEYRF